MLAWRSPKLPSTQRHIFLIGAPSSGGSLVEAILAGHPNFSCLRQELAIFSFRNILESERLTFSLTATETAAELFHASTDIVEFYDQLAGSILKTHKVERFFERTPQNVLHLRFLKNNFPNAQFINLIRDGRDCFCSALSEPNITQSKSVEKYARYWRRCIESRTAFGNDPNIIDIQYEALTSNFEQVTKNLMNFLGETALPEQLEQRYCFQAGIPKAVILNNVSDGIDTFGRDQWRTKLSEQEVKTFERIAGSHLRRLGYKLSEVSTSRNKSQNFLFQPNHFS